MEINTIYNEDCLEGMKHYGDVSKINGAEVEPVDIITFGSPCQDLSVAGKRAGIQDGERSNLFFEAIRIIKEMREATNDEYPKYAVWENVPGAFSSNKGHDFHAVLEAFCSVCDDTISIPKPYDAKRTKLVWNKAGEIVGDSYSIVWRTLDAQYWGVPQRRKRIYLVADFTGGGAGEILFKPEGLRGNITQGDEAGEGATTDAVGSVDRGVGAVGIDGYNFALTGDKAATVGVNCGISTGRNGVIESVAGLYCFSFDSLSSNSMKSSNPISGCRAVEVAKCIDTTYPDPSKNQGGVAVVEIIAFTQNQREEVRDLQGISGAVSAERGTHQQTYISQPVIALQAIGIDQQGGKGGANYSENMMPPMCSDSHGTPHAVCYAIDRESFNCGQNYARNLGITEDGINSTLNAQGPSAVCYDARGNGDGETACTITGDHQNRITDYTAVAVQELPCTASGKQHFGTLQASCAEKQWLGNQEALTGNYHIVQKANPPRRYIIRRLTPTECARLQGFPDWWSELAPYNPDDAEFWEEVRKTDLEIRGKNHRPVKSIEKWYEKLHADSAEYKMWGNGIALPNAEYVLRGIAEHGAKTLGSLFDGSGGFPLAGVLNGIKPIWASEVELYPIAVTKSRFKEVKRNGN